jgi:hypothetical protein
MNERDVDQRPERKRNIGRQRRQARKQVQHFPLSLKRSRVIVERRHCSFHRAAVAVRHHCDRTRTRLRPLTPHGQLPDSDHRLEGTARRERVNALSFEGTGDGDDLEL